MDAMILHLILLHREIQQPTEESRLPSGPSERGTTDRAILEQVANDEGIAFGITRSRTLLKKASEVLHRRMFVHDSFPEGSSTLSTISMASSPGG
jgi:hypothetical protein